MAEEENKITDKEDKMTEEEYKMTEEDFKSYLKEVESLIDGDVGRLFYEELKNADPTIPYEETIKKALINNEQRLYDYYCELFGEEDDEEDGKFLHDKIEKDQVLFLIEKALDSFDIEAVFECFETDISHPIRSEDKDARDGMDQIEHICFFYNIDELAQLEVFKDKHLQEHLIERTTNNDKYPYTMKLLEKLKEK